MNIRAYDDADFFRVQELMKRHDWELPTTAESQCFSRVAICDENKPVAFGFSVKSSESYLVLDNHWSTPAWRWEALKLAHDTARDETTRIGVNRSITWVPWNIVRAYEKRLKRLGWQRQERPSFLLEV